MFPHLLMPSFTRVDQIAYNLDTLHRYPVYVCMYRMCYLQCEALVRMIVICLQLLYAQLDQVLELGG